MKQKNKKQAGFSLIEVLFTILFLSLIVFGMLRLQTSNLILDNTQKNQIKANLYAHQALEILAAMTPASWANCGQKCYLQQNGNSYSLAPAPTETLDGGLFIRTLTSENDGLAPNSYLFTAHVEWADGTGDHQVVAKRLIFD